MGYRHTLGRKKILYIYFLFEKKFLRIIFFQKNFLKNFPRLPSIIVECRCVVVLMLLVVC